MTEEELKFYLGRLKQFVGGRIIGTVHSEPDELGDRFFGLQIRTNGKTQFLWFLQDDEGNGPGSFDIQDAN
jgi:hypothetical protein